MAKKRCFCGFGITCTCGDCNSEWVHISPKLWALLKEFTRADTINKIDRVMDKIADEMNEWREKVLK